MFHLRFLFTTVLAAVLGFHFCSILDAALTDYAADVTLTLADSEEDGARAAYNGRHEEYPVDVRRFAFHSRILGRAGESRTGDWKRAQDLATCGLLSDTVQSQLNLTREGTW